MIAKRLLAPNPVWAWYLAREIAMYRAFTAQPPAWRAFALARELRFLTAFPDPSAATASALRTELAQVVAEID